MDDLEDLLRSRLQPEPIDVPATVDEAILGAARAQLEGAAPRQRRRFPRLVALPLAAAAAAMLFTWSGLFDRAPAQGTAGLDVVDAYRLTQQLQNAAAPDARHDHDGNGRVDRADVEALLRRAVRVPQGAGA